MQNITSQWFTSQIKSNPEFLPYLESVVVRALPASRRNDTAYEHVNEFVMKMVKRDAFAPHLGKGELAVSKVGTYLKRSVWNDVRQGGVNPVNREFRKFRTFTDKAKGYKPKTLGVRVVHTEDDTFIVDEGTPEITYEDQIFWHRVKTQIAKTVKESDVAIEVCRLKVEENTIPEISAKLNLPQPEVKAILARLKKVLRPLVKGEGA